MARTPNDDRSDSKNPNNPAYWSSQNNTSDDDYDEACGPSAEFCREAYATVPVVRGHIEEPVYELTLEVTEKSEYQKELDKLIIKIASDHFF